MTDEQIEAEAIQRFERHCITTPIAMFGGSHARWEWAAEHIKEAWRQDVRNDPTPIREKNLSEVK